MNKQQITLIYLLILIAKIVAQEWLDEFTQAVDAEYNRVMNPSNRTKRFFLNLRRFMNLDSDFRLMSNTNQVIDRFGYKAERYSITTSDGYILLLHRIVGKKNSQSNVRKPAVLLQHGLVGSSIDWVLAGPKRGLGFILSDNGYDVWLGNARGNRYARKHNRSISAEEFWDFSWHEIGKYDLPKMIDHILRKTGHEKLAYVGYSQGTTASYVLLSERPEYNSKISSIISLAPVCYFTQLDEVFQLLSDTSSFFHKLLILSQTFEVPSNGNVHTFLYNYCNSESFGVCKNVLFKFFGLSEELFDPKMYLILFNHFPSGSSVKQVIHYAQIMRSNIFRQFDYGEENIHVYKRQYPPKYNLNNIRVPVTLFVGSKDRMARPTAAEKLYKQLPNPNGLYTVPHPKFSHLDFLWAKNLTELLNNDIVSVLRNTANYYTN